MNESNVAIVTGASGGIGRAIAEAMLEAGYHVVSLDRRYVHRIRSVTGKDGNPLNELELVTESLMNNGGRFHGTHQARQRDPLPQFGADARHLRARREAGRQPLPDPFRQQVAQRGEEPLAARGQKAGRQSAEQIRKSAKSPT